MRDISLYERIVNNDEEFPVQVMISDTRKTGTYFSSHWHEHIELNYFLEGQGLITCNQTPYQVDKGSVMIINSNELHEGSNLGEKLESLVIIFRMDAFSKEVANYNLLFQSHIAKDEKLKEILEDIYREKKEQKPGYKLAMKGRIYELITCLLRNYVMESLSEKENLKRTQNLERINKVIQYIHDNYTEAITITELSNLIHLSEYRFCHLFKDSIGKSPLNYMNEFRLKKAHQMLEQKEKSISEVALAVGFQDYNNFGRLFRRMYGYPPSGVWNL